MNCSGHHTSIKVRPMSNQPATALDTITPLSDDPIIKLLAVASA